MSTQKFVYNLADGLTTKLHQDTTLKGLRLDDTIKATASAQPLRLRAEDAGLSIATDAGKFQMSLDSGAMLAKSVKTGEVKTFAIRPGTVLKNISLGNFEVRDARVQPKYNFTKADPGMVNIFAHKGPDEPKPDGPTTLL